MGEGHVRSREEEDFPSPGLRPRHGLWREAVSVGVFCLFFLNKSFFPGRLMCLRVNFIGSGMRDVKQAVELTFGHRRADDMAC